MQQGDLQGQEKLHTKPTTIKDIARLCGVHYMTVSRALSGDVRVKAKTAARILEVAKEIGYDLGTGYAGRRLVEFRHHGKTINHIIGVFFPQHLVRIPYFAEMFEGIMTEAANAGYTLHLIPTMDPEAADHYLSTLPTFFKRGDLDGIIFTQWTIQHASLILRQLREEPRFGNRPITVLMAGDYEGCSTVRTDDYVGMAELMRHLLDLGHRHFMHNHYDDGAIHTDKQRCRAMRDACLAYGLDPEQCLHFEPLDWNKKPHQRMELPIDNLLKMHPEVTAVIAPNDYQAERAYEILQRNGRRIPDDISLVGFDDTTPIHGNGENLLTTVHLPLEQLGREAAQCLIQSIEGTYDEPKQIILPSGPVIVRKTTGPAPNR